MDKFFGALAFSAFGLWVTYVGVMVRLGKLRHLFLGGGFPVLAPLGAFLIAVPIGLGFVVIGLGIVFPEMNLVIPLGVLFFATVILSFWTPAWIQPPWLRWLNQNYGHVLGKMFEEARFAPSWSNTLPDPTGTSLTLTDNQGNPAGYVLYDAYGGVLSSTLTPDLETALAGQGAVADPSTGLVHLGGGRYYDPALGRPLQPDPIGGPPAVPQALNRYAATSVGPPGVAQAVTGNPLATALWHQVPGTVAGLAIDQVTVPTLEKQITKRAVPTAWGLVELIHPPTSGVQGLVTRFTQSGFGQSLTRLPIFGNRLAAYYASRNIRTVERMLVGEALEGSFGAGETIAIGAGSSVRLLAQEITYVDDVVARQVTRGLGKGLVRGLTAGASGIFSFGFQYYTDYDNPYLTGGQKLRRAGISGFVGFGAAGVGLLIGGPVGFGVGLILGIAGDLWLTPLIFEFRGDIPKRNLAPFLP